MHRQIACELLVGCRYSDLMFGTAGYEQSDSNSLTKRHKQHTIERLDVYVYSFDQSLNLDTDESYTLTVSLNTCKPTS